MDQEKFTDELRKTLRHELTHHVESMAGDRTLEKWDEEQAEKRKYGTIKADSILFVDDDGMALAPMAAAMFHHYARDRCAEVNATSACLNGFKESSMTMRLLRQESSASKWLRSNPSVR